jgi:hypothetical protein
MAANDVLGEVADATEGAGGGHGSTRSSRGQCECSRDNVMVFFSIKGTYKVQ